MSLSGRNADRRRLIAVFSSPLISPDHRKATLRLWAHFGSDLTSVSCRFQMNKIHDSQVLSSWPGGGPSRPTGKCSAGFICALLAQQVILLFPHSWFSSNLWLMIHQEHVFHRCSFIQRRDRAFAADGARSHAAGSVQLRTQQERSEQKRKEERALARTLLYKCCEPKQGMTSEGVCQTPHQDLTSDHNPPLPPFPPLISLSAMSHVPAPVGARCEGCR